MNTKAPITTKPSPPTTGPLHTTRVEGAFSKEKANLIIQKRFSEMRKVYMNGRSKYSRILVLGDIGTGKTQLAATCPRPVLIHSFDPGGTKTKALQGLIQSGDIIVDSRFEDEDWSRPSSFRLWQAEIKNLIQEGAFDGIGTYVLDSMTMWSRYALYEIARVGMGQGVPSHPGKEFYQSDYMHQQLILGDLLVSKIFKLPCHVLCTAHIQITKDDLTGAISAGMMMWGRIADQLPLLFDEKYVMRVKGNKHELQTKNDGVYKAETRMGGDTFQAREEPDIRALLKRAGLAWEDKPSLNLDLSLEETEEKDE